MNRKIDYLLPTLLILTMAICSFFAIIDEAKYFLINFGIIQEKQETSAENVEVDNTSVDNVKEEVVIEKVDFEKLYPFKNERHDYSSIETSKGIKDKYLYYLDILNYEASAFESNLMMFDKAKDVGSFFKKVIVSGAPYISSEIEETSDHYFVRTNKKNNEDDYQSMVEAIDDLKDYLDDMSIPMLYIEVPTKISVKDEENYISGYGYSYVNYDNQLYVDMLKDSGIELIDLKDYFYDLDDNYHALYYKTDHHYKVSTGYEVSKIIVEYLINNYGLDISEEYLDENLYETIVYEDAMFGSEGQTVGSNYASREDFEFLNPTFDTDIKLTNIDIGIDKQGSFLETILDTDKLEEYSNNNGGYAYECLIGGNRPLTTIENLNSENDTKILILKDSYALAAAPYLSLTVDEVDLIDTRSNAGNFNGSVRTYIENNKPDIVLLLYGSNIQTSTFD